MKSRSLVKACAGFFAVVSLTACMRGAKSKVNADEPAAKPRFDINDVSILMKRPSKETRDQYLRLGSKASEGPFLTKEQFDKAAAMLSRTNLLPYEQWALSAVRIDNCGKLFPTDSCQPQIRLVFQPLWTGAEFSSNVNFEPSWKSTNFFGDAAIHLAYDITDAGQSMQMYQDFLTLKMKNSQVSSDGMLGEHPILASQGMQGEFAKTLHTLVLKYSRVSKLERIAIMGADVVGGSAVWEFAATTN
ncbi:MAG: hypothetical protein NTX25_20625, partial [Proteobacteria bacterium]|nr:hypothetical protein [Pseudomonadota bacterium]